MVLNRDFQLASIRQLLQLPFPSPPAGTVGNAVVALNQQPIFSRIPPSSYPIPPSFNGSNRKRRRVVGQSNHNESVVPCGVVNPIGDCFTFRPTGEVVIPYVLWGLPPTATFIAEGADEFLFLGVHADDGVFQPEAVGSQKRQVPKLAISLGVVSFRQTLTVGSQRIVRILQQSCRRGSPHVPAIRLKFLGDLSEAFVRPFESTDWVARLSVLQQFMENVEQFWFFCSRRFRPPPFARMRESALTFFPARSFPDESCDDSFQ